MSADDTGASLGNNAGGVAPGRGARDTFAGTLVDGRSLGLGDRGGGLSEDGEHFEESVELIVGENEG